MGGSFSCTSYWSINNNERIEIPSVRVRTCVIEEICMKLELDEIQFMKIAIDNSDPFCSVKEAKSRVYRTSQSIADLEKQLVLDKRHLAQLEARDNMVKKLKDKLSVELEKKMMLYKML